MKFETDYIEKLARVLADTGLTEISLEDGEQAITLRKDVIVTSAPVAAAPAQVQAAPAVAPVAASQAEVSVPAKKVLLLLLQWLEHSTNHHLLMLTHL